MSKPGTIFDSSQNSPTTNSSDNHVILNFGTPHQNNYLSTINSVISQSIITDHQSGGDFVSQKSTRKPILN